MRAKDENKERAIKLQAIELIVKEGFDGLSMQKLAKAAGISSSTIYIYFENREDLLNKLYLEVDELFTTASLKNFDPSLSLKDGLWLQWKNRYKHILQNPLHFHFAEQFRNSPLIQHSTIKTNPFRKAMQAFVENAIRKGELAAMPAEVFWALAYGPFYTLVKFHLDQSNMAGKSFSLSDALLKETFNRVLKALAE
jgi:TetR/AcrR family transcriptional repressor of multidrug resistance operon